MHTEFSDGRVEVRTSGSLLWDDGTDLHILDPTRLRADERAGGFGLAQSFTARQEEEDGPVEYIYRVVRPVVPEFLSVEELLDDHNTASALRGEDLLDLEQFQDRYGRPAEEAPIFVDESLAGQTRPTSIRVLLREGVPLELPRASADLAEVAPDLALDARAGRLLSLESHWTAIEQAQQGFLARVDEEFGPIEVEHDRLLNAFDVEADPALVAWLAEQPEVRALERIKPPTPHVNHGTAIREAAQVQQFLDNNLNGEQGSGRNPTINDILIAITDSGFDTNHPAWDDWSNGPSRLKFTKCHNGTSFQFTDSSCWATGWPSYPHGTFVAAQAVADLTQGQDGSHTSVWESNRTGMTTESAFIFLEAYGAGSPTRSELITELMVHDPDIVNASWGADWECDNNTASRDEQVDLAHYDGMFWVSAAGNKGHNGYCNVGSPATAPSSFTVGALNKSASNLRTAGVSTYTARGQNAMNRNMIDAIAIGGRQGGTAAWYNDSYAGGAWWDVGTSFAAPVVAGAAANFKHQLVNKYGATGANSPGVMFASMLLMVDHYAHSSGVDPDWAFDPVSGGGRLRMRKINKAGMDAPWEFHIWRGLLNDGQTLNLGVRSATTSVTGNASGSGWNPPLPGASDQINVAGFVFEPNVQPGESPATISMSLRLNNQVVIASTNSQPGQLRMRHAVAGQTGIIRVVGTDLPPSVRSIGPVAQGEDARDVVIAWFFEDKLRDDSNGPPSSIQ